MPGMFAVPFSSVFSQKDNVVNFISDLIKYAEFVRTKTYPHEYYHCKLDSDLVLLKVIIKLL